MYIAFKWLLGLTLAMWIAMCCLDTFVKRDVILLEKDSRIQTPLEFGMIKNKTVNYKTKGFIAMNYKEKNLNYFHCLTFIAGVSVVLVYNKANNIVVNIRNEFTKIFTSTGAQRLQNFSKVTAIEVTNISTIFTLRMWEIIKKIVNKARCSISTFKRKMLYRPRINILLLKKLKEMREERKNLADLLLAALHENKNIRMQFQLETMAKNRLATYVENTQKIIKENRSRYVSFQQLYLVTHEENTSLKFRLKKLTREKADADKNLLELMNEIYKSKNNELKTYCNRFIVNTKNNLLNADVTGEIQKFLKKSGNNLVTSSNWMLSDLPDIAVNSFNNWLTCTSCTQMSQIIQDSLKEPLISEAPKLKGLPGEYVWTVKDKDGVIEKLYEYDCECDLDNGEIIRRIREYSVYHDKDCLLDFSNSSTVLNESWSLRSLVSCRCTSLDHSVTRQRFLTGSEAFKKFMQNSKNVISTSYALPETSILTD